MRSGGIRRLLLATAGNPDCGRLGHANFQAAYELPTVVQSLSAICVKAVTAGGAHTATVSDDGSVLTFGLNDRGQLGHSQESTEVLVPREVALPEPAVSVAAGNHHTLCITESGNLWAWGCNREGQLGLGSLLIESPEPRLVASLKDVKVTEVAAGAQHSLAVTSTGEVYSWGCGDSGRLGHGTPKALSLWGRSRNEIKPRLIRALETQSVERVAAGFMHSACVTSTSKAFFWGSGRYFQLGRPNDADASSPIDVPRISQSVQHVACGGSHSLALLHGGSVFAWGADQNGCLGLGKTRRGNGPDVIPNLRAVQISAGWKHSAAISHDRTLWTWGWGGSQGSALSFEGTGGGGGQLMLGNDFDYWAPAQVTHISLPDGRIIPQFDDKGMILWHPIHVSCGLNHTAAIFELTQDVL